MTVSKPKINTLFSLGIFMSICLTAAGVSLYYMLTEQSYEWYRYAMTVVFGPLGLGLLFRSIFSYKVARFGKGAIEINYPTRWKKVVHQINDIKHWRETKIKTMGGNYKELEIMFENSKKLNLSMQEHTNYPQVIKYLKAKSSKKMKS
jgi:hypothetical protein